MLSYTPGEWRLIATPQALAFVPADVDAQVAVAIWRAMASGDGFAAVLETLVGTFGMSMSSLPPFAVVSFDAATGAARVVVRGAIALELVHLGGERETVTAVGVTTWTERAVPEIASVRSGGAPLDASAYGIRDGVVPAGAFEWELHAVEAGAEPEPLPQAEPAPEASEPVAPLREPETPAPVPPPPTPVPAPPLPELEPEPLVAVADEPLHALLASGETQLPDPLLSETYAPAELPLLATSGELELSDETTTYDDLIFGETRMGTVEDAAVRADPDADAVPGGIISAIPTAPARSAQISPSAPAPSAPAPPAASLGDHDGETISAAQLAALQGRIQSFTPPPSGSLATSAVLRLPSGETFVLDRSAIVGRRPRAVRATGAIPLLVQVDSPSQDVSRSHVELRVEGGSVLAVDLDTTNGTRLLRSGADPVRLHPGDPTLLVAGDRLDISDGVVLEFEGL